MRIARLLLTSLFLFVLFLGAAAPWSPWMPSGTSGYVWTGTGVGNQPTFQPGPQSPLFISARITADGTAQSTAHGLGVLPRVCSANIAKLPALAGILTTAANLYTPGTHTSTNCVFTVLAGAEYYVRADA